MRMGDGAAAEIRALRGKTESRRTRTICTNLLAEIRTESAVGNPQPRRREKGVVVFPASGPKATPSLHIHTLGPLRIDVGDRVLVRDDWPFVYPLHALLYLVMRRSRWVRKNEITKALWKREIRNSKWQGYRHVVHELRKALEPGPVAFKLSRYLETRPGPIRLKPGPEVVCDVVEFEEALKKHKSVFATRTNYKAEREDLSRVILLYTGEFAEDLPDERFLSDERERLGIYGYVRLETSGAAHESGSVGRTDPARPARPHL